MQLASGSYVHTPWNKKSTSGTIPYEIRTDVLPSDGGDLIAHTVNGYGENGIVPEVIFLFHGDVYKRQG